MLSGSCGTRDRPNPAPRPGERLASNDNQKTTRGSPVHQRRSPYSYLYISPPGSPDQKADEQSDVRKQRYLRTWAGVWGNIDREFRTSRRALNVLSVRAGLSEQAMLPHTPAQVRRDYDSLTIGAKPFISFLVWPVFSN